VRIVIVAHEKAGGIGTFAQGLARALPRVMADGDELLVVGVDRQQLSRAGRFWHEQVRLPRALRDADVVHLCDFRPVLLSRRPFVLTIHDIFFFEHPEWFPPAIGAYKRAMFRAALRKKPRTLVCTTEYVRNSLLARFPGLAERVRVIPPGVDARPADAPSTVTRDDDAYFLTVSTVEVRKNHLTLLAAFRRARAEGLQLRWKIAGRTGYRGDSIVAALRNEPGVDVLGQVSTESLDALYGSARFVAIPSLAEGFGFPALEAASRDIPVVCSRGSGMDETIGDGALRVEPTDVHGWSAALLRMEGDEILRGRLRTSGHAQTAKFDWEAAARAYVACYRDALAATAV
jgi:glycosyltransferase involved in cell wall biosynthesis